MEENDVKIEDVISESESEGMEVEDDLDDGSIFNTTYKVTLADGTVIDNLKLNGNNFVSSEEINPDIFEYNCSPVKFGSSNGHPEEVHDHMELVQVTHPYKDEWWFILRDLTDREMEQLQMKSDIEYLSMMTGVEL